MGLQGVNYKIDIAFVIDATGSMTPIMDQVRARALTLGDEIRDALEAANKPVGEMRIRLIDYADYASEGDDAIHQTDFFNMPADKALFEQAVKGIVIDNRGGDAPENGLEGLFVAMNSDWTKIKPGEKGRHIIVLITDAYPLNLHEREGCIGYPSDEIPADVAELESIWEEGSDGMQGGAKSTLLSYPNERLVIYAPAGADAAGHSWDAVSTWTKTVMKEVDAATGLVEIKLDGIIDEIVRSC